MSNNQYKIIYSLNIHIRLQEMGFHYLTEMKNPANLKFNCWVYNKTPELEAAFDAILRGGNDSGNLYNSQS